MLLVYLLTDIKAPKFTITYFCIYLLNTKTIPLHYSKTIEDTVPSGISISQNLSSY